MIFLGLILPIQILQQILHDFNSVILVGAIFTNTLFEGVNLRGTDFSHAIDLQSSTIEKAERFDAAKFEYVDLSGKDFSEVINTEPYASSYYPAGFDQTSFKGANLTGTNFEGTSFTNNRFYRCKFKKF